MLWQTKSGRSGCFVETKGAVVPWARQSTPLSS
jgi:hypothetical protein